MANDSDEGLVMALSIDGLELGDENLKAMASSLIGLARYTDRKELQLQPATAVYNVVCVLSERSSVGMAFVPTIVERFPEMTRTELHQHLLQLDRDHLIELRPDSGLGRFMQCELDACPDGPMGSKLLWARNIVE
jgi:hypothetical protein